MLDNQDVLLSVKDLKTHFFTEEGVIPGVDGLSFDLHKSETLVIAGESGCGKSVTSLSIMRLIQDPPGKIIHGQILYKGMDLVKINENEMRKIRGNEISMIFQEPMTSLNPVFTVGSQIMGPLLFHQKISKQDAYGKAIDLIRDVGIPEPERCINRYPHQLSGGMRQRVMIAMALACNPQIIIADEPTTALDVTIQAQILKLLEDIKNRTGTPIILITHDMGVVAQVAQTVLIMYAGKMVEYSDVDSLFSNPLHPYTEGLLASIPSLSHRRRRLHNIEGSVPSPKAYSVGCRFSPRCEYVMDICREKEPELIEIPGGRKVCCWKHKMGNL
jgi:oligopeptide/dipeptide ABC transporter ATP-binding protein